MLPSWIRSKNCKPRLVYFFAIEITRRKFASTISFLARRAFASPILIRRLMSLIRSILKPVLSSIARNLLMQRMISGLTSSSATEYFSFAAISRSIQLVSVSLLAKCLMKFFFGNFAICTACFMMIRSCTRTRSIISRMLFTMRSNCLGTNLKVLNSSPISAIAACESG